jgi:hypothetical protein
MPQALAAGPQEGELGDSRLSLACITQGIGLARMGGAERVHLQIEDHCRDALPQMQANFSQSSPESNPPTTS